MTTVWPPPSNVRSSPVNNRACVVDDDVQTPVAPANASNSSEVTFDPQSQSNPYYLHANESPALELVSSKLDGPNYHPWARAMTMALSCKNKLVFVDGSILKPSKDDRKYSIWERNNNMVVSWIIRALSPTIGRSVLWIDTAYGIWNDLKRRFSQQDLFRIAEIKCEIYQTTQGDNSLNEYFTRQKLLCDELMILRPPFMCDCNPRCACSKKIDEINNQLEKDMLSIFLVGLHERYTGARNQIMLMKPLPDVSDAYSMIAQQEMQFQIGSSGFSSQLSQAGEGSTAGSVFLAKADNGNQQQTYRKPYAGGNKKPVCTFCGFTGHT